jgi:hypothetical protein
MSAEASTSRAQGQWPIMVFLHGMRRHRPAASHKMMFYAE